jgi:hypothetical protein
MTRRSLRPSDLFILYTDGLCDAATSDGMTFGTDRLYRDVREQGHRPTPELFDFLLDGAKTFSGRETFEDDVCILGIQMLPCAVEEEFVSEFSGHSRQSPVDEVAELATNTRLNPSSPNRLVSPVTITSATDLSDCATPSASRAHALTPKVT